MTPDRLYSSPDTHPLTSRKATHPTSIRRTLRLAALPTAPRIARAFVGQVGSAAGMSDAETETAKLLVSELVTNAARATGRVEGPPTPLPAERVAVLVVLVRAGDGTLRLDVWDQDPTPPTRPHPSPDDESGRGLQLVDALAHEWGVYLPQDAGSTGKVVWAEVAAA